MSSLLFLPGGGLVAPLNFTPAVSDSKIRQKLFVTEAGKAPAGRDRKKSQDKRDGQGKDSKAPAFGGRLNGVVNACKAPSSEFALKSSLTTKEMPTQGPTESIGETTVNVSVGTNSGVDSSARWAKTTSKKYKQFGVYGLNAVPEFDVGIEALSARNEPAKATVKLSGFTWAPKLCGGGIHSDTLSFNASSSLVLSREPLKLPLALSKDVLAWIRGRTGGVVGEARFPTVWDSEYSVSSASTSVTSSVRGYMGHGLHWGLTGTLRAGGVKTGAGSEAAEAEGKGKKPQSQPQRYSAEGRLMLAHKRVEATAKAAVTPKSVTTNLGVFTSVFAPLDVGVQLSVPLFSFTQPGSVPQREQSRGKSPGASRGSKEAATAKVAGKLSLGKSESISASYGLVDGKIGVGYKWEGHLAWLAAISKPAPSNSTPLPAVIVNTPTVVNVFGPVGAEAVLDATGNIRRIRSEKPLVAVSTQAVKLPPQSDAKGKPANDANNLVLALGTEMDIKANALVQKVGGSLQVKL